MSERRAPQRQRRERSGSRCFYEPLGWSEAPPSSKRQLQLQMRWKRPEVQASAQTQAALRTRRCRQPSVEADGVG
jgi:hypothetical protein